MAFNTISVIGMGYIGLPTAAVFAGRKIKVIGVEVNASIVDTINKGKIHIVEPDLDMVVHAAVSEGYLRATSKAEPADAFLIAVPTPFKKSQDGRSREPDLSYIKAACEAIAPVLKKGDLVVLESTSPVGTTEQVADWLEAARPDITFPKTHLGKSDIRIAHCPERVLPGHVLRELVQNDRVIGGMTPECSQRAKELYKTFVEGECVITNCRTAEMSKLAENSFRDVNIAFANELSMICDKQGIDVWELISLANRHPRVEILQPGAGVGGHCIAVDPWFIVAKNPDEAKIVRTAREVNDSKPEWVIAKVKKAVAGFLLSNPAKSAKEVTVACFGLAFKPDIDDLRESPALNIVERLCQELPTKMLVVEPHIQDLPIKLKSFANLAKSTPEAAFDNADICVLLVGHSAFKTLPLTKQGSQIEVDTVGLWRRRRTTDS